MNIGFDTALTVLLSVVEENAQFGNVTEACIVRDLRGRVRLVMNTSEDFDMPGLQQSVHTQLGGWFNGPILNRSQGDHAERRLAATLLQQATSWPGGWPTERPVVGNLIEGPSTVTIHEKWTGLERVLSKQAWLDNGKGKICWSLTELLPTVVAFYSFKGGVGRSTLLGIMAYRLAKLGKVVICLDLDLESPGLNGLFDTEPKHALIDQLLTHAATGHLPDGDPITWTTVWGTEIGILPAGHMNHTYLEKLARLDYLGSSSTGKSPVAEALDSLLRKIKSIEYNKNNKEKKKPDFILLDCRTGLHDLGGLSLNDIAHIDVLVGRDTPQGRDGLALTLEVLSKRRSENDLRIQLVQTMVPLEKEAARTTKTRFNHAMYEACRRTIYASLDDLNTPEPGDTNVSHFPYPVRQYDEIALNECLADISVAVLENNEFTEVLNRLVLLASPEPPDADEDE